MFKKEWPPLGEEKQRRRMDGDIAEGTDGDVLCRDAPCQRRCTSEGTVEPTVEMS